MSFELEMIKTLVPSISLVLILVLFVMVFGLQRKIKKMLRGKNAATLEDTLLSIQKDVNELILKEKYLEKTLGEAISRLKKSVQKVGIVRFNPFKGTSGSNQSFSLALLDENDDGVIVSALYSRERVSTFAKPITNGKSEYELSPEEKRAISQAMQQ